MIAVDHLEPGEKSRALQGRANQNEGASTMVLSPLDMLDVVSHALLHRLKLIGWLVPRVDIDDIAWDTEALILA